MDANGLHFWMLAEKKHWKLLAAQPDAQPDVQFDDERKSLRLTSRRVLEELNDDAAQQADAEAHVERIPQTIDSFATRAYWGNFFHKAINATVPAVVATGAFPTEVPIYTPEAGQIPTDLATGYDGVLYMAIDGRVVMKDLRNRWDPKTLRAANFKAWRLAADPNGGAWVLDRENLALGRVEGYPLDRRPFAQYAPETFRPSEENRNPAGLTVVGGLNISSDETPIAIACSPQGRLALVTWVTNQTANLRLLDDAGEFGPAMKLKGANFPYSMTWVSDDRVAVLFEGLSTEAPVYLISDFAEQIEPVGDMYPLRGHTGGPFLNGITLPPHYPTARGSLPLHPLSLPSFVERGNARNNAPLDSGSTQTIWHRLYLEAFIPPGCGVKVYLAANNSTAAPADNQEWHEHRFGEMFANDKTSSEPRGAWVSSPSEIPFHQGMLHCEREKDRSGLFTVLVQRSRRRVRTLGGRYIHVRVELIGDGRATPEVAALRVYGSRFSYLNRYLPELYRETEFGADADEIIPDDEVNRSTQADFLERFLDNFEGILTPLEDRIANSYLLTDPRTVPEDALEWLGSWIGVAFDSAYPPERRRRHIQAAPELYKMRGTLGGLKLALDVATGGAVTGGEVIVLEDFRLRRTFATILGADLADEKDPLLGGIANSGNSYVGDTLFLGDERKKEFLALFNADLPTTLGEERAIEQLFDGLAHRVTVLVHQEVEPQDLGLIRRIVDMETPAHILWRVERATNPFMVGMAALVGVDTYLATKPPISPVRIGRTRMGERDRIQHPPSLDPRLEGGRYDQK